MMKPKFADVVEFVKDGQKDPEMEKMLSAHPDGPELLKQARFICKMLENEAQADRGGGIAAAFSLDFAVSERVAEMRSVESAAESEEIFAADQSAEMRPRLFVRRPIDRLID